MSDEFEQCVAIVLGRGKTVENVCGNRAKPYHCSLSKSGRQWLCGIHGKGETSFNEAEQP